MIDVESLIRDRRDHLAPLADAHSADWGDVLARAGVQSVQARPRRGPLRLALAVLVAVIIAAGLVAVVTPVGGAIAQTVRDFSAWLRGQPGGPASEEEQRAFEEANARSFAAFPGSPELRRLIRVERDGVVFDLLGFRSGGLLCIRIVAGGAARGSTLTCAPVNELEHDDAPARVLLADWGVGRGEKRKTIGFDTYTSPYAQVTAGIAADGVEAIELVDDQGTHRVPTAANAFLYIAERPEVGQRVTHVRAQLDSGETVGIPFTVSPSGTGGGFNVGDGQPGGPTRVERDVDGGRIGWIERREARGAPLDVSAGHLRLLRDADFARVLAPDEGSPKRIVISINRNDPGAPRGPMRLSGLCHWLVSGGGASGGCMPHDRMFEPWPFTFGYSVVGAGDQFATFAGIASDDVARLEVFTATGNRIRVPLKDNAFLAEVSLARFPVKMVAYDAAGRVIAIAKTLREEGGGRVTGDPILELRASEPGVGSIELRAHRTREGGECWFTRGTGKVSGITTSCTPQGWSWAPVRVGLTPHPPAFVYGRVRNDIAVVELHFADGSIHRISPGARGYLLEVLPEHLRDNEPRLVEIIGRSREGKVINRQRVHSPKRP
jgi:hypothetical protein